MKERFRTAVRSSAYGVLASLAVLILVAATTVSSSIVTKTCSSGLAFSAIDGTGTFTCTGTAVGSGTDVTVTSIADGDFLAWASGSSKFTNRTKAAVTAMLNAMVGDTGSGGSQGMVPVPGAGDAAAGKFLKADGTWTAPAGSSSLSGSSDVTLTSPANSDLLAYNSGSSKWTNRSHTAATALLDAMVGDSGSGGTKGLVPAPGSGDAAAGKFLSAGGTWGVPSGTGGGGSSTLSGDSDVAISSPVDGQVLAYNAVTSKWNNVGAPFCSALIAKGPPPALTNWTQVNISSPATAADSAVGPIITDQMNASYDKRALIMAAPSLPFTADFLLAVDVPSNNNTSVGVGWSGSLGATGVGGIAQALNGGLEVQVRNYTSSTSTPTTAASGNRQWGGQLVAFRLVDDRGGSGNLSVYRSVDCANWNLQYTGNFSTGSIHTGSGGAIGFWLDNNGGTADSSPYNTGSVTLLAYYPH